MRSFARLGDTEIGRRGRPGLLAAAALLPTTAMAQTPTAEDFMSEAERQFRIDPRCPPQTDPDEVVVCGRRAIDPERYRLPIRPDGFDPGGTVKSASRERNALIDETGGGVASCSNVGPGGMYGCAFRDFKRDLEQRGK